MISSRCRRCRTRLISGSELKTGYCYCCQSDYPSQCSPSKTKSDTESKVFKIGLSIFWVVAIFVCVCVITDTNAQDIIALWSQVTK